MQMACGRTNPFEYEGLWGWNAETRRSTAIQGFWRARLRSFICLTIHELYSVLVSSCLSFTLNTFHCVTKCFFTLG